MTAEQSPLFLPSPRASSCKMPPSSFLARPCSTSRVSPGASAESVYSKVQHFEGETLSVQCSYKSRKNHVGGKVWCKIRKKKCETGFTRVWAQGPRYLLQDDAQAKVVNITMVDLRRQDSGRYWCMRNSSGILYPLMGFQLEVSPGYSFTSPSSPEPRRTTGLQTVTASPSNTRASSAGPASIFTTTGHLPTRSPTTSMCHTSRSPLDKLPPIRNQDSYPIVLLGVLTFLSVPVMLIVVYGFWKKRHMGSYSVCRGPARHRKDPLDGRSLHGSQLGLKPCMEWGSFSQRSPRRPEEEGRWGPIWIGARSRGEDVCRAGLRPFQNQRLHFTCTVPLDYQEPGEGPTVRDTRQ
ncbi:trem-like transcript 2 protein isoform 3-T3 [Hipposideros larvatus]